MADKYVSHGNTFNGDGTSVAEATVNGGVGAWNDLDEVFFDGVSYGSIDAGDHVYMRTSVSGVDIFIQVSADRAAKSYGAKNNPVFFIADDGTKWAGEDGQITYAVNSNNYEIFTGDRGYVWWLCGDKENCRFRGLDNGTAHAQNWMQFASQYGSIFEGIETDVTLVDSTTIISMVDMVGPVTMNNCNFRHFRRRYGNGGYSTISLGSGEIKISGSYFDATDGNNTIVGGIGFGSYGSHLRMRGVKCKGFPAGNSVFDQLGYSDTTYKEANLRVSFCDFGLARTDYIQDELSHLGAMAFMSNINNQRNTILETGQGYTEWAARKNYPAVFSTLPSANVWSLKVKNGRYISQVQPFLVGQIKKLWNQGEETLKVTLNFVIKDTSASSNCYDNIKAKHFFVCMYYTDATTGRIITQFSPIDDSDLVSSSTVWLPKVDGVIAYGENSYNAKSISLTTESSVQDDSMIGLAIVTSIRRSEDTDYNFVDPDILLEVV